MVVKLKQLVAYYFHFILYDFLEQLYEIRKSSMSRLICDNAHDIDEIQPLAFVLANEK